MVKLTSASSSVSVSLGSAAINWGSATVADLVYTNPCVTLSDSELGGTPSLAGPVTTLTGSLCYDKGTGVLDGPLDVTDCLDCKGTRLSQLSVLITYAPKVRNRCTAAFPQ